MAMVLKLRRAIVNTPSNRVKHATSTKDYKAIRFWGEWMCSFPSYIVEQQNQAFHDNAPLDAIYKNVETDQWMTLKDVKNPAIVAAAKEKGFIE